MEKIRYKSVRNTRSGLIARYDSSLGLLAYSPYSGLIYAIHESDMRSVIAWIEKKVRYAPSEEYEKALGSNWFISHRKAQYPIPHLLPQLKDMWPILLKPKWPIVINWFITGFCPLKCTYCYAEDLMHDENREPSKRDIKRIAESILSYKPLAVVLTGGEPICSPHISNAIEVLHERCGIIIDTCAYNFNSKLFSIIKKYNVAVRISFDSEIEKVNRYQRPVTSNPSESTMKSAFNTLCDCLDRGITVSVQSVATKKTANDLPALGDKLFRLGVHSWRIFKVQPSKSSIKGYLDVIGDKRQKDHLYNHIFGKILKDFQSKWKQQMSLQITQNEAPNAVILVSPDGVFYTESNTDPGKVVIDKANQGRPSIESLFEKVNAHAHAERYLNLTSTREKLDK